VPDVLKPHQDGILVQLKPYEPYVPKVSKLAFVARIEHSQAEIYFLNTNCHAKSYLWLGNI
jgi:hypothetical protein